MPAIVWSDVVAVAPSMVTGVSASFQTLILGYVNEVVQASEFGGENSFTFKLARAYLAAHYAYLHTLDSSGAAGDVIGPIVSKSEGGVSISYGSSTTSGGAGGAGLLGSSDYGDAFMSLVNRSPARAGFLT